MYQDLLLHLYLYTFHVPLFTNVFSSYFSVFLFILCFVVSFIFLFLTFVFFFFKQKTAYEMRISDWSSDVCSSDLQFPVALDIFVRALRSGHPIASAIDLLTKEMEDPIGSEFGLISDEVSYGANLIGALEHLADRWDLEDMRMFVVSLSVQSQTGGNLAEILENISKVIRDRHQMFMKVRALSSEGRATAWMLSVLPVFAFVSIFLSTPSYYLDSAEDPIFLYGAIGLTTMYVIGVLIIRRLVDLKV